MLSILRALVATAYREDYSRRSRAVEWASRKRWAVPTTDAHRNQAMTTTERVAAFQALYDELDALITPDEMETYQVLQHLGDLIEDLQLEEG